MSNPVNISDAVYTHIYFIDLTYRRSFSSDSSVLSFQFARVSLSISGFEGLFLKDEDEDFIITICSIFHYTIVFRCIIIILWYV